MKAASLRRTPALLFASIFLCLGTVAAAKTPPPEVLHVGAYRVTLMAARGWKSEAKPEEGYALFYYSDKPAMTTRATIGLFRIVVPPAARGGERGQIAAAYATEDAAGAQQALFKSNVHLLPLSKKTKAINGGQLFSYAEPLDATGRRRSSTIHTRGWVFFPANFAETGALFLVLGHQVTPVLQARPEELERAEEIIAGIREP